VSVIHIPTQPITIVFIQLSIEIVIETVTALRDADSGVIAG